MDKKEAVIEWLKTLNQSYRKQRAEEAGVTMHFIHSLLNNRTKNPGYDKINALHNVMEKEVRERLGQ